jgi:CRISPR type IV-associated protein Csf1
MKFVQGGNFMDSISLAGRHDPRWECGWCASLCSISVLGSTAKSFITATEALPIFKGANRRWVLENLPAPPFVAVCADAKGCHQIWRTPITMSRELVHLRIGSRLMTIRMPLVYALAAELSKFENPFRSYDWDLKNVNSGILRFGVTSPELERLYPHAGPGEWWALLALLSSKDPERPEPILFGGNKPLKEKKTKTKK